MICPTCQHSGKSGFVLDGNMLMSRPASAKEWQWADCWVPCPDCNGTGFAHCCEGLVCNEPDTTVDTNVTGRLGPPTAHKVPDRVVKLTTGRLNETAGHSNDR